MTPEIKALIELRQRLAAIAEFHGVKKREAAADGLHLTSEVHKEDEAMYHAIIAAIDQLASGLVAVVPVENIGDIILAVPGELTDDWK